MRGLALEGGGSRGAYQIGVVKAYLEEGYEFDGYVGTSIGAINAAALAEGNFEKALSLWKSLSTERLFNAEESVLIKIGEEKWDMNILTNIRHGLRKVIDGGGFDTSKIRAIVESNINEERIRESLKDFGLVTVSFQERKPYELFLEDIPKGELISYIMASACFPGFQSEAIGSEKFIDGGIYNNCPINMLLKKGYKEIIAIRTKAPGVYRNVTIPDGVNVKIIETNEDLGSVLVFKPDKIKSNIKMGYYDGLRALHNLRGSRYYVNPVEVDRAGAHLMLVKDKVIYEIGKLLGLTRLPAKRLLFETIIPKLSTRFKLEKGYDYLDFVLALLEQSAMSTGIERYRVYDYDELISAVKENPVIDMEKSDSILSVLPGVNPSLKYNAALQLLLHGFLQNV